MKNKSRAVLLFNSRKITLSIVSDKGGFGCREYTASCFYSGASLTFFVNPGEIEGLISDLISRYVSVTGKRIGRIELALPLQFFYVQPHVSLVEVNGKVTESHVKTLRADKTEAPAGYTFLTEKEGGFSLDKKGDFLKSALGKDCACVQLLTVSTFVSSKIHELFTNIAKSLSQSSSFSSRVSFVYLDPAYEIVNKLYEEGKTRGILLQINQLTTDVVYFEPQLPVSKFTLTTGSFHFVDRLSQKFDIPLEESAELLTHVNLGLDQQYNEYTLCLADGIKKYSVRAVNSQLISSLEPWAEEISEAIRGLVGRFDLPVYTVGSSIMDVHGVCEILSQKTDRKFFCVCPDFSVWRTPEDYLSDALFETY